jgi:hypothetical protein
MNVKKYTAAIHNMYELTQPEAKTTLIEYISYTDQVSTGYRVESKFLHAKTVENMSKFVGLELVSVHPTLDRTVIVTYHFQEA